MSFHCEGEERPDALPGSTSRSGKVITVRDCPAESTAPEDVYFLSQLVDGEAPGTLSLPEGQGFSIYNFYGYGIPTATAVDVRVSVDTRGPTAEADREPAEHTLSEVEEPAQSVGGAYPFQTESPGSLVSPDSPLSASSARISQIPPVAAFSSASTDARTSQGVFPGASRLAWTTTSQPDATPASQGYLLQLLSRRDGSASVGLKENCINVVFYLTVSDYTERGDGFLQASSALSLDVPGAHNLGVPLGASASAMKPARAEKPPKTKRASPSAVAETSSLLPALTRFLGSDVLVASLCKIITIFNRSAVSQIDSLQHQEAMDLSVSSRPLSRQAPSRSRIQRAHELVDTYIRYLTQRALALQPGSSSPSMSQGQGGPGGRANGLSRQLADGEVDTPLAPADIAKLQKVLGRTSSPKRFQQATRRRAEDCFIYGMLDTGQAWSSVPQRRFYLRENASLSRSRVWTREASQRSRKSQFLWGMRAAARSKGLYPVLLIPGVGATQLHAQFTNKPHLSPVWLSGALGISGAIDDPEANDLMWKLLWRSNQRVAEYLWSTLNPETHSLEPMLPGRFTITCRKDGHGLRSIASVFDQDEYYLFSKIPASFCFRKCIDFLQGLGYVGGRNLFGFPYDWRRSVMDAETLERLHNLIKYMYTVNGRRKICVIAHSMGGLMFGVYMRRYRDEWHKYVGRFCSVCTPWLGAAGAGLVSSIYGYNLRMSMLRPFTMRVLECSIPCMAQLVPHIFGGYSFLSPAVFIRKLPAPLAFTTSLIQERTLASRLSQQAVARRVQELTDKGSVWDERGEQAGQRAGGASFRVAHSSIGSPRGSSLGPFHAEQEMLPGGTSASGRIEASYVHTGQPPPSFFPPSGLPALPDTLRTSGVSGSPTISRPSGPQDLERLVSSSLFRCQKVLFRLGEHTGNGAKEGEEGASDAQGGPAGHSMADPLVSVVEHHQQGSQGPELPPASATAGGRPLAVAPSAEKHADLFRAALSFTPCDRSLASRAEAYDTDASPGPVLGKLGSQSEPAPFYLPELVIRNHTEQTPEHALGEPPVTGWSFCDESGTFDGDDEHLDDQLADSEQDSEHTVTSLAVFRSFVRSVKDRLAPSEYRRCMDLLDNCAILQSGRVSGPSLDQKLHSVRITEETQFSDPQFEKRFTSYLKDQTFRQTYPELAFEPDYLDVTAFRPHLSTTAYTWEAYQLNGGDADSFCAAAGLASLPRYPCVSSELLQRQEGQPQDANVSTQVTPMVASSDAYALSTPRSTTSPGPPRAAGLLSPGVAPPGLRDLVVGDTVRAIASAPDPATMSANVPWAGTAPLAKEDHLYKLLDQVTVPGTIYHELCRPRPDLFRDSDVFDIPAAECIPEDSDFLYMNVAGYGYKTAFHAVYPGPIYSYEELNYQKPQFLTVEGDGTVPLVSSLSDGIPERYVYQRVLLQNSEHQYSLRNPQLFEYLLPFLHADLEPDSEPLAATPEPASQRRGRSERRDRSHQRARRDAKSPPQEELLARGTEVGSASGSLRLQSVRHSATRGRAARQQLTRLEHVDNVLRAADVLADAERIGADASGSSKSGGFVGFGGFERSAASGEVLSPMGSAPQGSSPKPPAPPAPPVSRSRIKRSSTTKELERVRDYSSGSGAAEAAGVSRVSGPTAPQMLPPPPPLALRQTDDDDGEPAWLGKYALSEVQRATEL